MSKILANEIANYGDDSPIDLKEGLNIPAGKPIQAAGSSGTSGQVLSTTGTSIAWVAAFDGNYNSLSNKPTIPAAQVNADWDASGGVSRILNKPVVPAQPSVTTAAAGTAGLAYNTANGEFTFTPPDLSNYDTAFGWGDHAAAGYITAAGAPSAFTGLTDTPSSITAKAFPRGNFAGDAIEFSSTVFENTNGLGVGEDNPISCLHLKRPSDAVYITFESNSGRNFTAGSLGVTPGFFIGESMGDDLIRTDASNFVALYAGGVKRFETTSNGVQISGDQITTGKLLYSNNYANAVDLPDASTYHGMFAHVHATGKGVFAHGGAWLSLVDETSSINELADVNTTSNSDGHVLKWDAGTSTWKPQPDLVGSGGSGIILSDLSVSSASASGGGSLSYGNTTGVFTYTPPDLSGYLTTETDPVYSASPAAGILSSNISNWDTAYGWGNHASAGYLTAVSLSLDGLTDVSYNQANLNNGDGIIWNGSGWVATTQQYLTSVPAISSLSAGNSGAEVIGTGTDDGEFKVTLQDNTAGGAGETALRMHTDSSVNVIEFNEGNPAAKSRLVLNHLTTTNAWSEIHFKRTGASPGTSIIRSGGGGSGGYIQFYPVDGNNDFQISGTGTYTRLNAIVGGSLTAGGLTYPAIDGTSGDVLTSDGAGNVTWQTPTGGGGGANVTISDTIPAGTPAAGDLWWESDKGRLKVYYTDTNSSQWVDVNPPLAPALSSDAPTTASSTGSTGDIRYDSGYVYICVATNTWKRAALATW
tara:strand:+ start:3012 stop:5285 length:2274 start_codon:yes stop_codon:yes gene_type:complete